MSKPPRARRRGAKDLRSRTPRPDGTSPQSDSPGQRDSPARRDTRDTRPLLDRILDTPHLAQVVPRLPPEVLHRVIQRCGLEDCGELVALATPAQLARVFDLDLWRTDQPGLDEQFDADRFGVWLEVLMESGATVAARTVADMDVDLVIAAVAQHVRVFDPAAVSPAPIDGDDMPDVDTPNEGLGCNVGGYRVVPSRTDSWDAIVDVLAALDAEHHNYFHRVMRGCRRLSNAGFELDGLDDLLADGDQRMFDLAVDREHRREKQGYATPPQARAFLQMSRQFRPPHNTTLPANPVARAYFRAMEETRAADADSAPLCLPAGAAGGDAPSDPEPSADAGAAVAELLDMLRGAGVLAGPPRALLDRPQGHAPRLGRIRAHMQVVLDRDPAAYATRSGELAYLANTIMAGCSIQARPFTEQEATNAAVAVCNLGLENWPSDQLLPDDFLVGHDLVSVFQVGWTVLHDDVSMYAAAQLISVLTSLRCADREIQTGLDALRIEMTRHWQAGTPWRTRDALDVIMILDTPAWATLLGLMDECPVIHAGIGASQGSRARTVSASAFEFISENSQIASVREFMQSLPETLRR